MRGSGALRSADVKACGVRIISACLVALLTTIGCSGGGEPELEAASTARVIVEPSTSTTTIAPTTTTTTLAPALDLDGVARLVRTTTDVMVPVLDEVDAGYLVRTPCQDVVVVLEGESEDRVHVVLDPGHGGLEPGSVTSDGLAEKDVNFSVATIAEDLLEDEGFEVTLTRYTDIRVPLVTRVEIAQTVEAALLVSIHHQGTDPNVPRSATPGTEVYYQKDSAESKRFAGLLREESVAELGQFEIAEWFAGTDAGATYRLDSDTGDDFYGMVRLPEIPAVLAEMSFLGNPLEVELLGTQEFLEAEARAIANAVIRWFTTDEPGSGFVEPSFTLRTSGGGGGLDGCVDPDLGTVGEVSDAERSRVDRLDVADSEQSN